jgi:hypothetical protein
MSAIGTILFAHGLAHIMGLGSLTGPTSNWNLRSGLLERLEGNRTSTQIGGLLFTVCAVGFVCAGIAWFDSLIPVSMWRR